MEVTAPNNVKIYNLSAGKSLPDWLSDRKKRALQKSDPEIRKRIKLIEDFDMPTVSGCIRISKDGNYVFATGTYKPRVRCFDVWNMSMKFERCFDAEAVTFEILSDDYSKLVFLQSDRYIELHAQYGRYYRTRIPKCGHDMAYHQSSCDLFVVGASSEIYRLNLEQGRFMSPFQGDAISFNTCAVHPSHELLMCGSAEGRLEAWDPRAKSRVGILDCALSSVRDDTEVQGLPAVTSLAFKDALTMAVGMSTGQILLYDIRSDKPYLVKDHMYGLPIKGINFCNDMNLVISMDKKIVKLWDQQTGKPFTSIEPTSDLNDLCVVPNTGLMFLANEDKKMLSYFIPALGPAPKWCAFLDSMTEDLEESTTDTIYDDYKFVTKSELEYLGIAHLIGSNLLRAYMHGYFIDIRLYNKAKEIVEPFAYEDYRQSKIRATLEKQRSSRVQLEKLPQVNRDLAYKFMQEDEDGNKKQQKVAQSLLKDDRFKALFSNPDFEVDQQNEEFRLLNPVVSKMDKSRLKNLKRQEKLAQQFDEVEMEPDGHGSSDESSSDDDLTLSKELKKRHRTVNYENRMKQREEDAAARLRPKVFALKDGEEFTGIHRLNKTKINKLGLGERLEKDEASGIVSQTSSVSGNREMTFTLKKGKISRRQQEAAKTHLDERKKLGRSAKSIQGKLAPRFWMGKRVG